VSTSSPTAKSPATSSSASRTTITSSANTSSAATTSDARSQNDQVISSASHASDNQAALGATAIRKILIAKLGLDSQENFNLNHRITQADIDEDTGDCYVKLGADAVNFEQETSNVLRSPNGKDVVFVQSDTSTPLVKCLVEVRSALGW
jgi:hypothetical protein